MVDGVLGGWKVSGILTLTSGVPFTVTAPISTFNQFTTGQTPDVSGALPKNTGQLQFDGSGACYFCGFKQVADPNLANIAPSLAAISTLFAQQGPNGVMLTDPLPGTLGNLAQTFFTGPQFFNLDASLAKDFRSPSGSISNLRTDWLNATNHEDFATATIDPNINSATFGRVTASGRGQQQSHHRARRPHQLLASHVHSDSLDS